MTRLQPSRPVVQIPFLHHVEVKPIFCTPPTQTIKAGETCTFTVTLEQPIPAADAPDHYDLSVSVGGSLIASCPSSVAVAAGEKTFDFTVTAASSGSGKVNIDICERVDKGKITATVIVAP